MGIYDRPYYRDDRQQTFALGGQRSMVVNLILLNAIICVADIFTERVPPDGHWLSNFMSANTELLREPWNYWKLLTYGFAHAPGDIFHIVSNMYMLWLFGRDVESVYGRREFLLVYLALIVLAGLVWLLAQLVRGVPSSVIGASGAVTGIFMLFVLHFPHHKFHMLFIPVPISAWVLGVVYVGLDLLGSVGAGRGNTAYACHLAGAGLAYLYYRAGIRLERMLPGRLSLKSWRPKPRLRVHDPDSQHSDMDRRADRILEKLHQQGADSLTAEERRILEDYSRRMRQKHG